MGGMYSHHMTGLDKTKHNDTRVYILRELSCGEDVQVALKSVCVTWMQKKGFAKTVRESFENQRKTMLGMRW
jgi:hypothetical protein